MLIFFTFYPFSDQNKKYHPTPTLTNHDMMDGTPEKKKKKKEVKEFSLSDSSFWVRVIQNMNPHINLTRITEQTLALHGGDPDHLRELLGSTRTPSTTMSKSPVKTPVRSPLLKARSPKTAPSKLRSNRKKKSAGASVRAQVPEKEEELKSGSLLLWSESQCFPQAPELFSSEDAEKDSSTKEVDGGEETDSRPGPSSQWVPQQTTPTSYVNTSLEAHQLSSTDVPEKDSSTETIPYMSLEQEKASPEVDHCSVSVDTSLLNSPQSSSRASRGRER